MFPNAKQKRFGHLLVKQFDPRYMDFSKWLNSFEYTIDYMPSSNCSKVEVLLDLLEPSVISKIDQKVAPANVKDLSYDQIVCHLDELYSQFQGEEAANLRFIIRDQFFGESVIHYMNALVEISEKCNPCLRNSTILINRLKMGLKDEKMKKILDDSHYLTFTDALIIAEHL